MRRPSPPSVDEFGRAVTGRPRRSRASEAVPLARGLLAAVGRLPSGEDLDRDAPLLGRLAALGRSLRPADDSATPAWVPLTAQFTEVRTAFRKVVPGGVPLTLLPAFVPLSAHGAEFAAGLLKEAEGRRAHE
ncbi:hypothetical protein [Streptomyces sp. NPDC059909]|uniref:hypothetical protein n=1 Tax=Streptomyces sp. NPDC059909 TaxID=3346998 RepID=UPI003649F59B